ncbi:MAG: hypothetical protein L6R36_002219 [Xanthoria steineri]|nr:MAG: hypothetical protein L6R36_002219 [Xanthoria steineri]
MSLRYILHSIILFPLLTLATPVRYIDVSKPGANLFEEPTCPDYATCAQVAQDYMNELWTAIANPAAVDRNDGLEPFRQHYKYEPGHSNPAHGAGIRGDLALRGIDLAKMFTWTTTLRDINTGIEDIIITYTNLFDTNKGVILAIENWHSLDTTGPLPWSELVKLGMNRLRPAAPKVMDRFFCVLDRNDSIHSLFFLHYDGYLRLADELRGAIFSQPIRDGCSGLGWALFSTFSVRP